MFEITSHDILSLVSYLIVYLFFPLPPLFRYNKMNVLHLHISDTGSFPVEIPSLTNVTAYGAYDSERYYSVQDVVSGEMFCVVWL